MPSFLKDIFGKHLRWKERGHQIIHGQHSQLTRGQKEQNPEQHQHQRHAADRR